MNTIAKTLRKRPTDTEKVLWRYLRAKQMEGHKFRRQEPIGKYIVDFVCHEKQIVIVDGGQYSIDRDTERDKWLNEQGYKVLRFWNNEVLTNIEGVLALQRNLIFKAQYIVDMFGLNVQHVVSLSLSCVVGLEVIRENCLYHPPLTPPIKGGEITHLK